MSEPVNPNQHDVDAAALNLIQHWLCDPEWGVGMLEDIAAVVGATGRQVENIPDPNDPESEGISTWARH